MSFFFLNSPIYLDAKYTSVRFLPFMETISQTTLCDLESDENSSGCGIQETGGLPRRSWGLRGRDLVSFTACLLNLYNPKSLRPPRPPLPPQSIQTDESRWQRPARKVTPHPPSDLAIHPPKLKHAIQGRWDALPLGKEESGLGTPDSGRECGGPTSRPQNERLCRL